MSDEPNGNYVTGAEFSRWRSDFQAFQTRLDNTLTVGFKSVNDRLETIDERGRGNSEKIARLEEKASAIEAIREQVEGLEVNGCGQYSAHRATLDAMSEPSDTGKWRRKAATGGGIAIGGAFVWEFLIRLYDHLKAIK